MILCHDCGKRKATLAVSFPEIYAMLFRGGRANPARLCRKCADNARAEEEKMRA